MVTLARAHLTWLGVVDDPVAERLLPLRWKRAASLLRLPAVRQLGRNASFTYLAARTLFYDRFVTDALDDGIRQVVVLGAGYDSRAWRMARSGVTFFEIDLAVTQADKRSRAPEGGPVYVAADLTDLGFVDVLVAAGFRPGEPTAFTVEGVTMYLAEAQLTVLLRSLAGIAGPSSRLAANFGVGFERPGRRRGAVGSKVVAAGGEEFRFRLSPADAGKFLGDSGWRLDSLLEGAQLKAEFLVGTKLAQAPLETTGFAVVGTLAASPE